MNKLVQKNKTQLDVAAKKINYGMTLNQTEVFKVGFKNADDFIIKTIAVGVGLVAMHYTYKAITS